MRKRGILTALTATVAIAVIVGSGVANATDNHGSGPTESTQVIKLTSITVEFNAVDVPPSGNSLGDQIIFAGDLYQHGKKVGTDSESCVVTRTLDQGDWTCLEMLDLPKGKISIAVLFQFKPSGQAPITGGTGAYRDAGGYIFKSNGGTDYTLHIDRLGNA